MQQKIVGILLKCTSFMSFLGGLYVVGDILTNHHRRRSMYHRIICMEATILTICSIAIFTGSWAMPEETKDIHYMAHGTHQTCVIQGSIIHFCNTSIFQYLTFSGVYSLMSVRYNFDTKRLWKFEPLIHLAICSISVAVVSVSIKNDYINPDLAWCWLSEPSSLDDDCSSENEEDCTGSDGFDAAGYKKYFMTLAVCFIFTNIISSVCILGLFYYLSKSSEVIRSSCGKKEMIENARRTKLNLIVKGTTVYVFVIYVSK